MPVSPEPDSTHALFLRARTGELVAMEAIFSRLRPRLIAWVATRLGPRLKARIEAEDIVQEVLLQASTSIGKYRPQGKEAFRGWIFAIAENCIRNAADREGAKKRDVRRQEDLASNLPGSHTSPSSAAARHEEWDLAVEELAQLGDGERTILRLRLLEQKSNEEAANILGITVKAAGVRYVRAMRALRDRVEQRLHGRPEAGEAAPQ